MMNNITDCVTPSGNTFISSSSSCSYHLHSLTSSSHPFNDDYFKENDDDDEDDSPLLDIIPILSPPSLVWISELRHHIEVECPNVLQNKIMPPDINVTNNIGNLPVSLQLAVMEEKFRRISSIFQNIFRHSHSNSTGVDLITNSVPHLSEIITTTQDLLSILHPSFSKSSNSSNHTCSINSKDAHRNEVVTKKLQEMCEIKLRIERKVQDKMMPVRENGKIHEIKIVENLEKEVEQQHECEMDDEEEMFKGFVCDLVRYGQLVKSTREYLTEECIGGIVEKLKKLEFEDDDGRMRNNIGIILGELKRILTEEAVNYARIFVDKNGVDCLLLIFTNQTLKIHFQSNIQILLNLTNMIPEKTSYVVNNKGLDTLINLVCDVSLPELILTYATGLLSQTLYNSNSTSPLTLNHITQLYESLSILLAISCSKSLFFSLTCLLSYLTSKCDLPKIQILSNSSLIHFLIIGTISYKGSHHRTWHNIFTILSNLSIHKSLFSIMFEENVIELCLYFCQMMTHPDQLRNKNDAKCFEDVLIILIRMTCNEDNIDVLLENNDTKVILSNCHKVLTDLNHRLRISNHDNSSIKQQQQEQQRESEFINLISSCLSLLNTLSRCLNCVVINNNTGTATSEECACCHSHGNYHHRCQGGQLMIDDKQQVAAAVRRKKLGQSIEMILNLQEARESDV